MTLRLPKIGYASCLVILPVVVSGQYIGGTDDGFSMSFASTQTLAFLVPMYFGGSDDGFSLSNATTQPLAFPIPMYFGGNDDGFSLSNATTQPLAFPVPMYFGGNDDGFSLSNATTQPLAFLVPMYFGGNDDGFSQTISSSQPLAFPLPMYFGGNDDGFALSFAPVQALGNAIMFVGGSGDGSAHSIAFNIPLPIDLMIIKAHWKAGVARITWNTIGEYNNDYFLLQRSTSGTEFSTITRIEGEESSIPADKAYSFYDREALALNTDRIYYRLRQFDLDGTNTFSPVVMLRKDSATQWNIHVYPNPVSDEFILSVQGEFENKMQEVVLADVNGKIIIRKKIEPQVTFKVTELASGVYFLMIRLDDQVIETIRILVVH